MICGLWLITLVGSDGCIGSSAWNFFVFFPRKIYGPTRPARRSLRWNQNLPRPTKQTEPLLLPSLSLPLTQSQYADIDEEDKPGVPHREWVAIETGAPDQVRRRVAFFSAPFLVALLERLISIHFILPTYLPPPTQKIGPPPPAPPRGPAVRPLGTGQCVRPAPPPALVTISKASDLKRGDRIDISSDVHRWEGVVERVEGGRVFYRWAWYPDHGVDCTTVKKARI